MSRSKEAVRKQENKDIPKKCPHCRSQRLEIMETKVIENGKILYLKGWFCKKCGYKNCRRLVGYSQNLLKTGGKK